MAYALVTRMFGRASERPESQLKGLPRKPPLAVSRGTWRSLIRPNNLIKRIGFGFHNFQNYRIRALLYARKPNWRVLGTIVVR
jgi:hypothetical protein